MFEIIIRNILGSKLKMAYSSIILFIILMITLTTFDQTGANKTEIQVNYETLCPDSVRFITDHLDKAIKLFKDKIYVKLIPFGIASYAWNEKEKIWEFKCQHGNSECFANMLHVKEINF